MESLAIAPAAYPTSKTGYVFHYFSNIHSYSAHYPLKSDNQPLPSPLPAKPTRNIERLLDPNRERL